MQIKFGTDGFRGVIADDFTFDNIRRIAYAIAEYFVSKNKKKLKTKKIIVGYDNRFLSEKFAGEVVKILAGRGLYMLFTNTAVPTPAVSCYIRQNKLPLGIIVTASHNPAIFNGIKIKNEFGASAGKETTQVLEKAIYTLKKVSTTSRKMGKIETVKIITPYIKFIKGYLNFKILAKQKFKVIVDSMHGTGSGILEEILKDTTIQVLGIRSERDVLFGQVNPEPIKENLAALTKKVKEVKCDLALALDGDADRIGAMCPDGGFINSHMAICLLLYHLIENKKMRGKVIKSINTTTMVNKIVEYYKLPFEEVSVGFKNIASKMLKEDVLLGGEESGGIGFKGYMPERDGILSGLLLLELMAYRRKAIREIIYELESNFGRYVYLRKDVKAKAPKKISNPVRINNRKVIDVKTYDGTKFILEDESWLLIRASGTEPIVRIYAESNNIKTTRHLIEYGCALL
ncbi:MAG: phosphoglucomutase/phosphomannomutase family protein [Candidatus Omnitrophica bacterium]|nr:phosphoglucomutase/phosphomannomutase family protein [Candidatus Omnitrophota bacterium]